MKSKTDMISCTRRSAEIIQTKSIKVVIVCMLFYSITPIYGATPWLHVDGNKIKDPAGNIFVLRGVAMEDLGCAELWRDGVINRIDRLTDKTNAQGSSPGWYTRVIRLAVYPSDQEGYNGPWYFDDNPDDYYNNLLRPVVDYCALKGLYVIIDWHYIADTGDHVTSTSQFWDYIAPRFAGDSHVLFELFNEPTDSSWSVVKANMQTWIDIVRSHAPNNLILVGGPQWCQILQPQITDPVVGDNIVYIAHLYPAHWYGGVWQINIDAIADCAAVHPVMMTEWGFSMSMGSSTLLNGTITEYGQPLMDFLELNGIGNTAWCADYAWGPPMFWGDWTLRCGDGEMGCFVKDTLYLRRNDDQPSPVELNYVDADANGTNDGSSWENAFKYLRDALAAGGAEIRVAEGVYKPDEDTAHPDGSGDRAATFQLKTGVAIKGGYAGYGAADPNERDPNTYETILSGDLNGDDGPNFANNGENSYHVVTGSGTNATAVLDGFTITAGNANGSTWENIFGGGMLNWIGSSPTLTNCTFSGNSAGSDGGGMYNNHSSPKLTNCTFSGNSTGEGGGIRNWDNSNPTLVNCTFSGNSAAWDGGGMSNDNSSPTLTNCTFSNNLAQGGGGGMFSYQCSATVNNCAFSGNWAGWAGGGMQNNGSNPMVTNCTFSENLASDGGGMHSWDNSSPTISNCILWGNIAPSGPQISNDGTSSTTVSYSDVQGSWPGIGNIDTDPLFFNPDINDFHLLPDSPCIDAGDPSSYFGLEPEPDGGRINMGAYGNTPEATCKGGLVLQSYNLVSKTRIGRTLFEYVYTMTLNNNSTEAVSNVVVELLDASDNVLIIDPDVSFSFIGAGESIESDNTFSIRVDRSIPVDATVISWRATYDVANGSGAGQTTFTTSTDLGINASDITGDGEVNFEDLAELAGQWLQPPGTPSADIAPQPNGDGIVNFLDFAKLAEEEIKKR